MVIKMSGIFGIAFVLSTLLSKVSGIDTIIAHFNMSQKHPELKECAANIVQKNECIAARRSQLTGQCESLPYSWGKDEIMESGYDYAKKIFVQENFQPPREEWKWIIHGVFKTGAKLDAFIALPQEYRVNIYLYALFNGTTPDRYFRLFVHQIGRFNVGDGQDKLIAFVSHNRLRVDGGSEGLENDVRENTSWSATASSKRKVKISLVAQNDSIAIFADDVEMFTYRLKFHPDILWQMFSRHHRGGTLTTTDRLQFTA